MGRTAQIRGSLVLGVARRRSYAERRPVRLRTVALVLGGALLAVSVAVLKEGPQPGAAADAVKPSGCSPKRTLVLRGRFLAGGPSSFQMSVTRAGSQTRALRGPHELRFDVRTRFRRDGAAASPGSLQPNDRLHVLVNGCKRAQAQAAELLARRVTASS